MRQVSGCHRPNARRGGFITCGLTEASSQSAPVPKRVFQVCGIVFADIYFMRIAIAHWTGRVSPVFDVSDRLLLIDVEGGKEHRREDIKLASDSPFERARELLNLGVEILICGAISNVMEILITGAGVQVFGFMCGDVESVIRAFISGHLADARFWMPGLHGKRKEYLLSDKRLFRIRMPNA